MSDAIGLGVVGAGSISVRGILPHLTQEDVRDRVRVVSVCDPVPGRASAAARRFGVDKAFSTFEELIDDVVVDAVTIASPIGLHYEQGRLALEAGKHVHFNKTMSTTTAEATELIELASGRGLRIVASPGEMLLPLNQRIRELLADRVIGELCWAVCGVALGTYHEQESVRHGDDALSNIDPSWYFRKPGGGPLYDVAVYPLHALTGILGPAKRVAALSGLLFPEREYRGQMLRCDADDTTFMLLDFGGAVFAVAYGTVAGTVAERFAPSFFGTEGSIVGTRLNGTPIDYPGRELLEHESADEYADYRLLPHVVGRHRDIEEMHVYEDIMQLVDWVRDDRPSVVTPEHARHVVEIIEAAYRAAESSRTQELTTTF